MNLTPKRKSKVSIIIVTWNAEKFIPYVLDSIAKQTFKDYDVLIVDNASIDGTVKMLENKYSAKVKVVKQKNNLGFSKAYNLGIHWTNGEYVLVMNQDVVLDCDFLKEAVRFMDKHLVIGALQGKIMQWKMASNRKMDIVDNLGIDIFKNHSFLNRFEGEKSPKLEQNAEPVFAFCGSCVLLRRRALEDIKYEQEFFDEDFFMYKEDIDLSWRLRHKNWDIVYYPPAIAYHARTLRDSVSKKNLAIAAHRQTKRKFLNYISYRNHILLLLKNEFSQNLFYYFLFIFWYEFKKFVFISLAEQYTLKAWYDILKKLPSILHKRKVIMTKTKLNPEDIRVWIK